MAQIDGQADHAAPVPTTNGLSPKAVAATVVSGLVGIVVALLNGLQADPAMLGSLPTWAQSLVLLLVPPVITFLAAYQAKPGDVS